MLWATLKSLKETSAHHSPKLCDLGRGSQISLSLSVLICQMGTGCGETQRRVMCAEQDGVLC